MSQITDDCFAPGARFMTTDEALARIRALAQPVTGTETVPLAEAAGRILAADVVADMDVPPHDNSAVDGYLVYFDDLDPARETRLAIAGRRAAGDAPGEAPPRGAALRVFTGAALPAGPDTVVMQEDCRREGDTVVVPPGIGRGANLRRAGEDVRAGATILRAGHRLRPQDLGLAAAVGRAALAVRARLRVAIFSTGDELREPGAALGPGAIYDANRYVLGALLAAQGCAVTDLGILRDDAAEVRGALAAAARDHDLLFTSGGVSVGEEDHVKAAVEAEGALHFWRLAIKPGRPLALGRVGATPFVGLPGNPVAAMVTFLRFARPLALGLAGADVVAPALYRVRAGFDYAKKPGRREWLRARLVRDPDGALAAEKFPRQGSGILSSLVAADGLVELPEDLTQLTKGEAVDFLPFNEVMPAG